MQLLLKENVDKLGRRGDIVEVKPGYARNYLLPQAKAIPVSPRNTKQIERAKTIIIKEEAERRARLEDLARLLSEVSCTITLKATDEGHLYGSVGPRELVEAIKAAGHTVDEHEIDLKEHIKEIGLYPIVISLQEDITAEVRIWVLPEIADQRSGDQRSGDQRSGEQGPDDGVSGDEAREQQADEQSR